jgi:putative FmdB family regulatory protein
MPTYEFTCPAGHDFEKFFRTISSGESELPCPVCGAIATRKISAGAGLMFKGSGFYITDYGKDGKKDQSASRKAASTGDGSAAASPSSDGGSGGGGDAKPASDSRSSSDSKSSESRSSETRSSKSDAKASDSKPAAAKPAESKPSAPKSSSSSE